MKNIKPILSCVALFSIGCANTSTTTTTDYFAGGELVAKEKERTKRNTLFMRTEASRIDATMDRTNNVVYTNGIVFSTGHKKSFGTQQIKTESQADAIKAAGSAVGNVVGEAGKAFIKP